MAKKYDITSPNKNLSALIDEDLQKESKLLQNLISEVVDANQKLKASHQKRLEETQEKLQILSADIKRLKTAINQKDHETTIEQLNYVLESKNRIFSALRDMRKENINAYLNQDSSSKAETLKQSLLSILEETMSHENFFSPYNRKVNEETHRFLSDFIEKSLPGFSIDDSDIKGLEDQLKVFNTDVEAFNDTFKTFFDRLEALYQERKHMLQNKEDEVSLEDRINETIKTRIQNLIDEEQALKESFTSKLESLDEKLKNVYEDTYETLKTKNKQKLEKEEKLNQTAQQDLKNLRLEIIYAEKTQNHEKLKELLKAYERREKANLKLEAEKIDRKTEDLVKREKNKILKAQHKTEKDYIKKLYALKFEIAKENIAKSDSSELFKLKEDAQALLHDKTFNENFIMTLEKTLKDYDTFIRSVLDFSDSIHTFILDKHAFFLKAQTEMADRIEPLKRTFKKAQLDILKALKLKHFNHRSLKEKLIAEIDMHAARIAYHQKQAALDKKMTDIIKRGEISQLSAEEDIQNEMIYQNALIDLADKEYELQLLKINSLYDSEITLTKAQAERLHVGQDINETMVSTTLQSQINFAQQQIKYAQSEFELRLENIDQALKRELEYAEEKLLEHLQPYKTDRLELERERDRKLEDLSYKQALFTEEKDKLELNAQQTLIEDQYKDKLDAITHKEQNDRNVQRYRTQIEKAKKRAENARNDAEKIMNKSIETFEHMLQSSEDKLNQFQSNSDAATLAPYIESEAKTTAKERLDESIEEAKSTYAEKVREPKAQLKILEEKRKAIETGSENKDKIEKVKAEKETIEQAFENSMTERKKTLTEGLNHLENERLDFIETHNKQIDNIDKKTDDTTSQMLQTSMKKQIKKQAERYRKERDEQAKLLSEQLTGHIQALSHLKSSLNDALKPAIDAYQAYLKKMTTSQKKREASVKKTLSAEMRSHLKNVNLKYK